jgi:hypothetical protein
MLLQAVTYIGAGVAFFFAMTVLGIVMVMVLTSSLPSKAKWDASDKQVSA